MTQLTRPLQAFSLILALAGGAGAILSLDAAAVAFIVCSGSSRDLS